MLLEEYYNFFVWKENRRHRAISTNNAEQCEEWLKDEKAARERYEFECQHFCYQQKHDAIVNALKAIRGSGYKAYLADFSNSCIVAIGKHGKTATYYASSGTIQGYGGTHVNGVDCFIEILGKI